MKQGEPMADEILIGIKASDGGSIDAMTVKAEKLNSIMEKVAATAASIRIPTMVAQAREEVAASQGLAPRVRQRSSAVMAAAGPGNTASDTNLSRGVAGNTGASGRDFAAQAQGLGGLVHVYATFAANLFAVSAAFNALSKAADTSNIIKGLDQLGAQSGRSLGGLAKSMVVAAQGAISLKEAMTSTALATSGGMTSDMIIRMTEVAKKASQALGRDMSDSMDRLTKGIVKTQPELLDELGIMTRVIPAQQEYARRLGISADSLTDFQKKQAFANAVIEEGERKFAGIKLDVNPYSQLAASFSNIAQAGLSLVNNVLGPIAKVLSESPTGLTLVLTGLAGILLKQAIPALGQFRKGLQDVADQKLQKLQDIAIRTGSGESGTYDSKVIDREEAAFKQRTKYATASAERQKELDIEVGKIHERVVNESIARSQRALSKENNAQTLLNRNLKDAATARARVNVSETASVYGTTAGFRELKHQYEQLGKASEITLGGNIKQLVPPVGALGKGLFYAAGAAGILATAFAELMAVAAPYIAVTLAIGAGMSLLVDHYTKAAAETEKFSGTVDMVSEATKTAAATIDLINKKPFLEQISVESVQARANATAGLADNMVKLGKDYKAMQDKMGEKSLLNADFLSDLRIGNVLYQSFIGVWYKGLDVFKNTNTMLSKTAENYSKVLAPAIAETFDTVKGTRFEKETRKSLEKVFGTAVRGFKDADDLRERLGKIGDDLIDKSPKYFKLFKETSDSLNNIASRATEAKSALDQMNKSFDTVMGTLAPTDPLGKLGEDTIKASQKLSEAFKDPISSLTTFQSIIKDVQNLRILPPELAKELLEAKANFEGNAKAVDELDKKLEKLQATENAAREKLKTAKGQSDLSTVPKRNAQAISAMPSSIVGPQDYTGMTVEVPASQPKLNANVQEAEKLLKVAEENKKDTERRRELLKQQNNYEDLFLRTQVAYLQKGAELLAASIGNQVKKSALEVSQGIASNLNNTESGLKMQATIQKQLIDVEIANIQATLDLAKSSQELTRVIEIANAKQDRANDTRAFERGEMQPSEYRDRGIKSLQTERAVQLSLTDPRVQTVEGIIALTKAFNKQLIDKITPEIASKRAVEQKASGKKVEEYVSPALMQAAQMNLEYVGKTAAGKAKMIELGGKKTLIDVNTEKAIFELRARDANQLLDLDIKRTSILSNQLDIIASRSEYQSKELINSKKLVEDDVSSLNLQKEINTIQGQINDAASRRDRVGASSKLGLEESKAIDKYNIDIEIKRKEYDIDKQVREQKYQELQRAGRIAQYNFIKDMELAELNIANIRLGIAKSYLSEYSDIFSAMQANIDIQTLELNNSKLINAELEKQKSAEKELSELISKKVENNTTFTIPTVDNSAAIKTINKDLSELEASYNKMQNKIMSSPKLWKPGTERDAATKALRDNMVKLRVDKKKEIDALEAEMSSSLKASTENRTKTNQEIDGRTLALQDQISQGQQKRYSIERKNTADIAAIITKSEQERLKGIEDRAKKERENALANKQFLLALDQVKNQAELDKIDHLTAMGYLTKESEARLKAENAEIAFNLSQENIQNDLAAKQVEIDNDKRVRLDSYYKAINELNDKTLAQELANIKIRDDALKALNTKAPTVLTQNSSPGSTAPVDTTAATATIKADFRAKQIKLIGNETAEQVELYKVVNAGLAQAQDAQDRATATASAQAAQGKQKLAYTKQQVEEQNKLNSALEIANTLIQSSVTVSKSLTNVMGDAGKSLGDIFTKIAETVKDQTTYLQDRVKAEQQLANAQKGSEQDRVAAVNNLTRLDQNRYSGIMDGAAEIAGASKSLFDKESKQYDTLRKLEILLHLLKLGHMAAGLAISLVNIAKETSAKISGALLQRSITTAAAAAAPVGNVVANTATGAVGSAAGSAAPAILTAGSAPGAAAAAAGSTAAPAILTAGSAPGAAAAATSAAGAATGIGAAGANMAAAIPYVAAAVVAIAVLKGLFNKDEKPMPTTADMAKVQGTGQEYNSAGDLVRSGTGYFGDSGKVNEGIKDSIDILNKIQYENLQFTKSKVLIALEGIRENTKNFVTAVGPIASIGGVSSFGTRAEDKSGFLGFNKSNTSIESAGVSITGKLGDIVDRLGGTFKQFENVKTSSSSFWGLFSSSNVTKNEKDLSGIAQNYMRSTLGNFREALANSAKVFGKDGSAVRAIVNEIDIGFTAYQTGETDQQFAARIEAEIGNKMDKAVKALFPGIEALANKYAATGETLTSFSARVQVEAENIKFAMQSIGQKYKPDESSADASMASRATEQNLIKVFGGSDKFFADINKYGSSMLTEEQRLAPVRKNVNDKLIELFPKLEAGGKSLITTREQFDSLRNGIDVTNPAMADLFYQMTKLGPSFADVTEQTIKLTEAELKKSKQDQLITILNLKGDEVSIAKALTITRQKELDGMDALLKPAQMYIYGLEDEAKLKGKLQTAYDKLKTSINSTVSSLKNSIISLNEYKKSSQFGDKSTLTAQQQYDAAKSQFLSTAQLASQKLDSSATTDQIAARDKALGALQGAAEELKNQSRLQFASSDAYKADFDLIQKVIDDTTTSLESQQTDAEKQLEKATLSAGYLETIDESTKTTAEYLKQFLTAQDAYTSGLTALGSIKPADLETGLASLKTDITPVVTTLGALSTNFDQSITGLGEAFGSVMTTTASSINSTATISAQQIIDALNTASNAANDEYNNKKAAEAAAVEAAAKIDAENAAKALAAAAEAADLVLKASYSEFLNVDPSNGSHGHVESYAKGGLASKGVNLVGEKGPELVDFQNPGRVYTASQTNMLGDNTLLVNEIKALRDEVAKLRDEQREQTGQIIISNYDANKKNAEVVASTTESVAKMQEWKERSKVVIS